MITQDSWINRYVFVLISIFLLLENKRCFVKEVEKQNTTFKVFIISGFQEETISGFQEKTISSREQEFEEILLLDVDTQELKAAIKYGFVSEEGVWKVNVFSKTSTLNIL